MTVSGKDLETEVVIQPECGRMVVCKASVRQQKIVCLGKILSTARKGIACGGRRSDNDVSGFYSGFQISECYD